MKMIAGESVGFIKFHDRNLNIINCSKPEALLFMYI